MIVLDASALIELLLLTPPGLKVAERVFGPGTHLHAPELIDLEVTQAVRRYLRAGELETKRGAEVLHDLASIRMRRHRHRPLMTRVWELRENLTAYDAAYVALAEALQATLVTRDQALDSYQHRARVEVL